MEELTFSLRLLDDISGIYGDVLGQIPVALQGSGAGDLHPAGSGDNGGSFFDGFRPGAPEVAGYQEFVGSYLWVDALHNSDLPSPEEYEYYEWGYYYLHDINADGTFELIMVAGVGSDATCLIYTWDGDIVFVGSKSCAYGVGVAHVPGEPVIVLCEYHGGYEEFLTLTVDVDRLTVQGDSYEPDGWVGLEPTGIGQDYSGPGVAEPDDGYQGPTEAPDGWEEPKDLPDKDFFMAFVPKNYAGYDCSGLYADEPYWDAQKGWAWCDVYLPISHPYAQEVRVFHVYSRYSPSYETWDDPGCTHIDYRMDWDVAGVWTLEGDGSFGGGTEGVRLEIYETGSDYVLCSYDIAVMENTFGSKEYETLVGGGNLPLEGPNDILGTRMCWQLVDQSTEDYIFYLNPEAGVYYRSLNSTTVFLQPMTRAE